MAHRIRCHDCGLTLSAPEQAGDWFCPRCRVRLGSSNRLRGEAVSALALGVLALWLPAMTLPLLDIDHFGLRQSVSVLSSVLALFQHHYWLIGGLVLFTLLIMPPLQMLALLMGLLRLRAGGAPRRWLWWYRLGREWAMADIFLLGVLIATTKLGESTTLHLNHGLICLMAMVVLRLIAEALAGPAVLARILEHREAADDART